MSSWNKIKPALILLLATATAGQLAAADKLDLDRVTPVAANEPIPVVDFFRPRLIQDPSVNLSGTHIAAIVAGDQDNTGLIIYDLATQKIESQGTRGDTDIDMVTWLNDSRYVYQVNARKLGILLLCAGEVGGLQHSYPVMQNVGASLIAVPPGDRTHPLLRLSANTSNTGKYGEVVSIDATLVNGKLLDTSSDAPDQRQADEAAESNTRHITVRHPTLETPEGFDLNYFADKEGQLAFAITSVHGQLTLYRLAGSKWEKCPIDLEEIKVISAGDNPGEIVVLGARQEGKPRALQVMEAATGKVVDTLVQDKEYDCNAWLYRDPASHLIVGATYDRNGPRTIWFDEGYRNLQKAVDGLFPGQVVRILGSDEGGKIMLINSFSDRQPSIYSWVDLQKHTAGTIRNSAPWIDPKRMRPMSIVKFKTRDGHQLDAYVTMPAGATKQNLPPLVVLPHDNNDGRDSWGFNAEAQFFASRGYAVMQPNYRGSSGSTGLFPTEDEWAYRKMSDDVSDATKTLISSGLVDGHRVAIVGTGFGGYLALSGAAFDPGLYRCAAAVSPVVDWARVMQDNKVNQFSDPAYSRMLVKLGDPKRDAEKFDAISPLRHADQIRAALLISNSEYDPSAQVSDTKDLGSTVERNHVPVEMVSFLNEAHGVRHLRAKVELYSRIEAFLAKNLAGGPPQ
jgi:dienelactone hydrolase